MIAFSKKRGRPLGSKNTESRPKYQQVPGAASSASSTGTRTGVRQVSGLWLYVPGEGFVRWAEIERQVAEAYRQWRTKKALQGVLIYDKEEAREIDVTGGRVPGTVRRDWLRQWGARHAQLCRSANVENIFAQKRMMNQWSAA